MRISFVTATGADDKTDISEMTAVSKDFPIEWGILLSKRRCGVPRFPSFYWIEKLRGQVLNCAGHLCGGYVRDLLIGTSPWALPIDSVYAGIRMKTMFQRYQINFHGINYSLDDSLLIKALLTMPTAPNGWGPPLIIQMDGVNDFRLKDVREAGFRVHALFDKSHGEGVLSDHWSTPIDSDLGDPCSSGYAGGLSPDNLSEQLKRIADVVGDTTIWIDAENHLRNEKDQFDLSLVRKFAKIAEPYL
jgi:hypothetical protein